MRKLDNSSLQITEVIRSVAFLTSSFHSCRQHDELAYLVYRNRKTITHTQNNDKKKRRSLKSIHPSQTIKSIRAKRLRKKKGERKRPNTEKTQTKIADIIELSLQSTARRSHEKRLREFFFTFSFAFFFIMASTLKVKNGA